MCCTSSCSVNVSRGRPQYWYYQYCTQYWYYQYLTRIQTHIHDQQKNIQVHSATSQLIFQYVQYWYNQYFPESSSICNTGTTSIFYNLHTILVLPVFNQNLPVSATLVQILVNTSIPVSYRIFQYPQY
jgi:hypothetical protein